MERQFDAYKLYRCMCPSNYDHFWDRARYLWKKSSFYYTPLYSMPPLGGSRRNIRTPFGTEKLEWCRYPTVKNFRRYVYSFWPDPRTWQRDRRTDRRTDTAWQTMHDNRDRAYASHRAVKINAGVECRWGMKKSRFSRNVWSITAGRPRVINIWTVRYNL